MTPVDPELPFSVFNGNCCRITKTVWSYCNTLMERKFIGICLVRKMNQALPPDRVSPPGRLLHGWRSTQTTSETRTAKETSHTGFALVRKHNLNCSRGLQWYLISSLTAGIHLVWGPLLRSWDVLQSFAPTSFSCLIGDIRTPKKVWS